MSKAKIAASIESLRAEIDKLEVEDLAAKTRLEALVVELERQLDKPQDASAVGRNRNAGDPRAGARWTERQ